MLPALKPIPKRRALEHHPRLRVGRPSPSTCGNTSAPRSLDARDFDRHTRLHRLLHSQPVHHRTVKHSLPDGWFRFVHEAAEWYSLLLIVRFYLFFAGDRWVRWQAMVPVRKEQWKEMFEVMKFYAFMRPTPVSKVGHNAIAAFSYMGSIRWFWLKSSPAS